MLRITEIKLPLDHAEGALKSAVAKKLSLPESDITEFSIFKRGTDARKREAILLVYTVDVTIKNEANLLKKLKSDQRISLTPDTSYRFIAKAPSATKAVQRNGKLRPVVVGFGPAGIFAALILAQSGFKPIVLERGKAVRERTKDTWGMWRKGELNPESNVQFGEGGAGTFSDGKLYSQIKDNGFYGRKVLNEFVKAGAPPEILYLSHPHIGTFKLVGMVEDMRANIIALGGEIRFESRVDDIDVNNGKIEGVTLANGEYIATHHLILAIGHSARDTFELVHKRGIYIEAKPFAIGFRIEHPQSLIDKARYGSNYHEVQKQLGAADYKLIHHAENGRAAYSFCMCPGGTVVAAASEAGRVVVNGMSQYSRNERNANSGIVVGIDPEDFEQDYSGDPTHNPLAGVTLQRQLESQAYVLGGSNYQAPAQLLGDFLNGTPSSQLGAVQASYTPGVALGDLSHALPEYAISAIREALPAFGRQIKGYDLPDALLTGVETRTSSPVRIKRNEATMQSINTQGLYPTGEGAGYAGGIFSAAVDGIKAAEAVALSLVNQ
ncbi:MAG: NAD(P)/FAD-dependent oxidoreductase [Methylophilaceae bacterium]|nr:NAD(P)/FAD-dependent oxidoreductase [Methylophilaceae bacterium]